VLCIKVSEFASSLCLALRTNSTDFEQDARLLRAVEFTTDGNEDRYNHICASYDMCLLWQSGNYADFLLTEHRTGSLCDRVAVFSDVWTEIFNILISGFESSRHTFCWLLLCNKASAVTVPNAQLPAAAFTCSPPDLNLSILTLLL